MQNKLEEIGFYSLSEDRLIKYRRNKIEKIKEKI